MQNTLAKVLLFVAFFATACLPAYCAGPQQKITPTLPSVPAPPEDLTTKLHLTAAQQQKIAAIDKQSQRDIQRLLPQINAKSQKLDALIDDPKASDQAIASAVAALAHVQIEIKLIQIYAQRSIERVYTPKQMALLKAANKKNNTPAPTCAANGCGGGSDPSVCGCGSSCNGNCN